ncbi:MAG: long-chain fatty acid--CoA ligase [Desulfitobacteriaceae bacterium]
MSGIKLFNNVPERFLPPREDWPDYVYAHPEVNWVHYRNSVNAGSEILDVGIAKHGWGNNIAIYDVDKDESWTYNRLQKEVNRLGNALKKLGVQPGDRVMWRFGEVPEAAVAELAIWKIGAINVSTALQERASEIEFIANDTEAVLIICQADQVDQIQKALPNLKTVKHVISVPESQQDNMLDYRKLLSEAGSELEAYPNLPGDAAYINYTGGTTGHPKGCIHTHATAVIISDMNCRVVYVLTPQDVTFCVAPIGHGFGNKQKINYPFRFGASAIYKERPTPKEIWELLIKYKVSIFVAVPTLYRMMLDSFDPSFRGQINLRLCVCSGEMLTKELMDRWNEQVGVKLHNGVGMVPMAHVFIQSVVNGGKVAPGLSVGKPLPGYEYKLIDENGYTVKNGEIGRMAVRGFTGIVY